MLVVHVPFCSEVGSVEEKLENPRLPLTSKNAHDNPRTKWLLGGLGIVRIDMSRTMIRYAPEYHFDPRST